MAHDNLKNMALYRDTPWHAWATCFTPKQSLEVLGGGEAGMDWE